MDGQYTATSSANRLVIALSWGGPLKSQVRVAAICLVALSVVGGGRLVSAQDFGPEFEQQDRSPI
jgi:hypothetical protein